MRGFPVVGGGYFMSVSLLLLSHLRRASLWTAKAAVSELKRCCAMLGEFSKYRGLRYSLPLSQLLDLWNILITVAWPHGLLLALHVSCEKRSSWALPLLLTGQVYSKVTSRSSSDPIPVPFIH